MRRQRAEVLEYGRMHAEKKANDREAALKWFKRNPGEGAPLCAKATGVPLETAKTVRATLGWEKSAGRGLAVGT